MPWSDRSKSLLVLTLLMAGSVATSLFVVTPTISLDDPFIGLRYATNFLAGDGLVYNPGEYVEGYTAFGWIMVGALGMWLGIEPLTFWQIGLTLSQVATLWLVYLLGLRPDRSPYRALLAPALLAPHIAFVCYPMMGMSSSFITMLVTLAVVLIDRDYQSRGPRQMALLGALFFAMCLTRFDGMIAVGILGLPVLWSQVVVRKQPLTLLPLVAVFGAGMLLYNGWRLYFYEGYLLPNTFYTKVSQSRWDEIGLGIDYLWLFVQMGGPFALLGVLLPLVARRASKTMVLAFGVAGFHLLYVLVVGGDWMPYFRFILTVLPLLCFLLAESLWLAGDMVAAKLPDSGLRKPATAGAVALVLAVGLAPLARSRYVDHWRQDGVWEWGKVDGPWDGPYFGHEDAMTIGRFLDQTLPADTLVCTEWAGIIPFYMRQPVFDMFGLSDKGVIEGGFPGGRMGRAITQEFLVQQRNPSLVVYCGRIYDTIEEARPGIDVRGAHKGQWIHDFFTELAHGDWGFVNCVVKLDGGYWPVLIKKDFELLDELCHERIP